VGWKLIERQHTKGNDEYLCAELVAIPNKVRFLSTVDREILQKDIKIYVISIKKKSG